MARTYETDCCNKPLDYTEEILPRSEYTFDDNKSFGLNPPLRKVAYTKPRMVARSSVHSKSLANNISVICANNSLSGNPNRARVYQTRLRSADNQHRAGTDNIKSRPISTPLLLNQKMHAYSGSLHPSGFNSSVENDQEKTLNIDDLLIHKNRSSSKLSVREFVARCPTNRTVSNISSPAPVIEYQENAIGTKAEFMMRDRLDTPSSKQVSETTRSTPVRVELMLIFVKIGQVDTVNERYQADIFLQARWREPLLDAKWNNSEKRGQTRFGFTPTDNPAADLTPRRHLQSLRLQDDEFWNPRLLLDNAQGEPIEIVSHEVEFTEPDFEAYLVEKRRIKGVFHETLELRHFPFDCQDLSVTVTCDRTIEEVELVPSPTDISQVDRRCAADSQEWKIFQHVDVESMEIQTAYSPGTCRRRHPGLVFTSRSARRSGYFLVNMVLISCVLSLLSFSVFSVPVDGNRLQLALLLLLTTVTFKFAASQNLPKISYLTYLDKVVLANFFMLVLLTVWHTIARRVSISHPKLLENEDYVVYVLLSSYCVGAVIFGLTVYMDAGSRRRLMQQKDLEFLQKKRRLEREKERKSIVTVALDEWLSSPGGNSGDGTNDFLD